MTDACVNITFLPTTYVIGNNTETTAVPKSTLLGHLIVYVVAKLSGMLVLFQMETYKSLCDIVNTHRYDNSGETGFPCSNVTCIKTTSVNSRANLYLW